MADSATDADHTVPAWFGPTMNHILTPTRILNATTLNCGFGDGSAIPFQIVPFNDGTMPTEAPHNLPPLVNVAAIRALTARQTIAYATGYRLGKIRRVAERRVEIGKAIGCTAVVQEL